jgi:hypothetical protein
MILITTAGKVGSETARPAQANAVLASIVELTTTATAPLLKRRTVSFRERGLGVCVWLEQVRFELVTGLHSELAERLA